MTQTSINLTAQVEIIRIIKKTQAKMFKDCEIGDILSFSIDVVPVGSNRGQTYASYIYIQNSRTGVYTSKSFNEIGKVLSCFELKQL